MKILAALIAIFFAGSAWAQERSDVIGECISNFASGDMEKYEAAVAQVRSWGELKDQNLQRAAKSCLQLRDSGSNDNSEEPLTTTQAAPSESPSPQAIPERISEMLAVLEEGPTGVANVVAMINAGDAFPSVDEAIAVKIEEAVLAYVKPIPASNAEANRDAYRALSLIRQSNAHYLAKFQAYTDAVEASLRAAQSRQRAIVKKLRKQTAEFDGSSWYRHPNSPRYQDLRPYLTLYILESGTGKRSLEFFINYTGDGWLFIDSAQLNIDGEFISLPRSSWSRDNDSDIWEWTGYNATPQLIEIAERIANSKRAVIRFNGQKFYDDYVIPRKDKTVIQEVLMAWEIMKE